MWWHVDLNYKMDIFFNYRSWYIIICIATALIYAVFLYIKNLRSDEFKRWKIIFLSIIRFSLVFILCLFLLEPVLKKEIKKTEKPIIVFAQDNSESILINKDSSFYKNTYVDSVNSILNKLKVKFDVHTFSFGSNVSSGLSFDYNEKSTDFGNLFNELNARYYGRNLGAVIIASDGIINAGTNPLYSGIGIKNTSLIALSLGDTNYQKDASIQKVLYNKVVGFENDFPVNVHLLSKKMIGETIEISIFEGDKLLESKEIEVKNDLDATTVNFILNASSTGNNKYNVKISKSIGELTYVNNSLTFYVDVLDELQNVLILANSPHPDIAAIKWVISDRFKREIDVKLLSEFENDIDEYDLIILHRTYLTRSEKITNLLKITRSAKIPVLHITGSEVNTNFFNELDLGVKIKNHQGMIDAIPIVNSSFSTFILNKQMKEQIQEYPPLSVPFVSAYKKNISSSIMIKQEINGEVTDYPMILLNDHPKVREGLIFGEGLWRWKMNEFLNKRNIETFKSLFSKITQYLISNDKKDRFEVETEIDYKENEPIHFYGEFYNKNFELILDAEIEVDITNDSGQLFKKVMIHNGSNYELLINKLPPGNYKYSAKTKYGNEKFEENGVFNVHQVRLEMLNSKADISYLNQLVNSYNGKMFPKEKMSNIYDFLIKNDMPNISHSSSKLEDLIKWKWLFLIISSLLFIEWFSRKRSGLY